MGNGALSHSLPWEEVPVKGLDLQKKTASKQSTSPVLRPWPLRNLRKIHVTLTQTHTHTNIITKTYFAMFRLMILLDK